MTLNSVMPILCHFGISASLINLISISMGNFNDTVRALQSVLRTQLLAPSWNALAIKLGSARSIFYRIDKGVANEAAIQNLLSLLHEHLYVDSSSLLQMEATIVNAAEFTKIIKPEMNLEHPKWQFQAILAFISHDYSHFSHDFRNGILTNILRLERTDPQAFFNMLAYFYIFSSDIKFYKKNKTHHKERCADVIEPLGRKLIDIFSKQRLCCRNSFDLFIVRYR